MDGKKIDLDALDLARGADQGFELELRTPLGDTLPGRMRIRGVDSQHYQDVLTEQQRRLMQKAAAHQPATPEMLKAEDLELSAALVIGWTCPFEIKGEPLPYTLENAKKLLSRWTWIREQIDRAARVRANFLPGSASA